MQDETPLTPAERELEAALAALQPAVPAMDRDAMMFRAGRVSSHRRMLPWRFATAALALALTTSLAIRPEPRTVERIVHVPAEAARTEDTHTVAVVSMSTVEAPRGSGAAYLRLRDDVLARGADALPKPSARAATDTDWMLQGHRSLGTPTQQQLELFGL